MAAAFGPRPVVVSMWDFKTSEYASLLGGEAFEPVEANPMLRFAAPRATPTSLMPKASRWNATP